MSAIDRDAYEDWQSVLGDDHESSLAVTSLNSATNGSIERVTVVKWKE